MGEEDTLATQHRAIMRKLDIALGVVTSFSVVGLLLGAIATYYMQKIETTVVSVIANEKEIAILKTGQKSKNTDNDRRLTILERVVFKE